MSSGGESKRMARADRPGYIERWARKDQSSRDREFYLVGFPVALMLVGLAPHLFQRYFFPRFDYKFGLLGALTILGAILVGAICYLLTRFFSREKVWGANRHRWPFFSHLFALWTPVLLLVDAPQRMAELRLISPFSSDWIEVAPYTLGISMTRTFLFAGGVVFFERLIAATNAIDLERARAARLRARALRDLIRPHFLMNSLNAVRSYIEEDPKLADDLLVTLMSLLRKVIYNSSARVIKLSEEIGMIADYVKVMNARYEADFKLIAEKAAKIDFMIPPLALLSVVENSFKHGFAGRKSGSIMIDVDLGSRVTLIARDDGEGGESGASERSGAGLEYVNSKLELVYGSSYEFSRSARAEGGYETVISLPWIAPEDFEGGTIDAHSDR